MGKWESVRLADVCELITDGTHQTPEYCDASVGYPFLSSKNVTTGRIDWENIKYIPEELHNALYKRLSPQLNDILLAKNGTTGIAALVDRNCVFDIYVSLALLRPSKVIDPLFLLKVINSPYLKRQFQANLKGIGVPNLHLTEIRNTFIPLPPLHTQRQIADILDRASMLIEKRKAQIEKLDLLVKSQFVAMFGDPMTNPMGWEVRRLDQISDSRLGKMLDAKKQTGEHSYPYLANFNVQWFRFDFSKLNEMDFSEADRVEFALEYGDLLVCEGGEVGRTAIWRDERENVFFQKAIHRVRCRPEFVKPDYLAWVMFQKSITTNFDGLVTSATIAHLTGEKLKRLMVQVPPLTLQTQFAAFVEQVEAQKAKMKRGVALMDVGYKALMQKCFRGEMF